MTRKTIVVSAIAAVLVAVALAQADSLRKCKQRGEQYSARKAKLERDAEEKLRPGVAREDVAQFFADHGLPFYFNELAGVATGTIELKGCGPHFGCGDSAILHLETFFDRKGTRLKSMRVVGYYNNCL
jgi:hypothetical protein